VTRAYDFSFQQKRVRVWGEQNDGIVLLNCKGVLGRVVKVVDFKPLALDHCRLKFSDSDFGFFHVRKLFSYLTKPKVPLWCPFVPEIPHRRAPKVFPH
jgi:hypothetical protein